MLGTAFGIWRQNLKRETGESRRGVGFSLVFGMGGLWVEAGCGSLEVE